MLYETPQQMNAISKTNMIAFSDLNKNSTEQFCCKESTQYSTKNVQNITGSSVFKPVHIGNKGSYQFLSVITTWLAGEKNKTNKKIKPKTKQNQRKTLNEMVHGPLVAYSSILFFRACTFGESLCPSKLKNTFCITSNVDLSSRGYERFKA